jgi:hypothetical protein
MESFKKESSNVTPATLERIVTPKLVKMTVLVMENVTMVLVIAIMVGLEHLAVTSLVKMNVVVTAIAEMELVIVIMDFLALIVLKASSKMVIRLLMALLSVIRAGQDPTANPENVMVVKGNVKTDFVIVTLDLLVKNVI